MKYTSRQEIEGFNRYLYTNIFTNAKAVLDYFISISSDRSIDTYFEWRAFKGLYKTNFEWREFAELTCLKGILLKNMNSTYEFIF